MKGMRPLTSREREFATRTGFELQDRASLYEHATFDLLTGGYCRLWLEPESQVFYVTVTMYRQIASPLRHVKIPAGLGPDDDDNAPQFLFELPNPDAALKRLKDKIGI